MQIASRLGRASLLFALASLTGCAAGNNNPTGGVGGSLTSSTGSTPTSTGTGGKSSASSSSHTASSSGATSSASTASSGTGGGTGGAGTGGGTGGGGPPPGKPLGADCTMDTDCQSMLCKPVVIDSSSVCVNPCTQQSDCGTSGNFFCEATTAGSTSGYCIPHSPAHCLSCMMDSDCGSLTEVCFQAPGDNAKACNVDCAIAGDAACPPDYSYTPETVNGQARQLCRPKMVPTCLDAVGGYCDRLSIPQSCARTNPAGTCLGQRTCMTNSMRFSACDATAPQCKTDCSIQDPAGCMETYCPSATSTVQDCGTCGTVCPGYMAPNDDVTCDTSQKCTFSCQGENYDVNNNPSDGCEVTHSPQGNHSLSTAANGGSAPECDCNCLSDIHITGHLASDKRVHTNPSVPGFDVNSGTAPDFYSISPTQGTFCNADIVLQLCVQGSSFPSCYQLGVVTNKGGSYSCNTDSTGCCPPDPSATCVGNPGICHNNGGQFDDSQPNPIIVHVAKTCTTSKTENVAYTISGHL